jgi:hypothetical protein
MTAGIHNPFAKKEKKEPKIEKFAIGDLDTDNPLPVVPKVHLDGGRYVIIIKDADTVEGAIERILSLMYTVAKTHESAMNRNGVYVGPKFVSESERALTHKGRQLTVYAPEDCLKEEAIYRRIAYTLLGIPLRSTYAKMGIEVYERNVG